MTSADIASLPWSEEAEQSVLGAVLTWPDVFSQLSDLRVEHFFAANHRDIFAAMTEMAAGRHTIDIISLHEVLKARGKAEECGCLVYLNALEQSVAGASNIRRHAGIVMEHALRRQIIAVADAAQVIAREPGDADEKLDRVASLFAAIQRHGAHAEPQSMGEVMLARTAHWEALEAGTVPPGMRTYLPTLDSALGGGLKPGKVVVIAARPNVGKTSLAQQIVNNVTADGHPALFLSQEMEAGDIADRAAANLGRVNLSSLTTGRFEKGDWARVAEAAEAAARLPLYIDDQPALTLMDIRAKARRIQQRHGLKVVVVDYLQLMGSTGRQESRHHQIEAISRGLKQLAKELGVCVLLLSQVSRQSTQRADGEPTLADLKESGSIEEDADIVCVLHPKGSLPDGSMLVAGILLKNRQGRRGRIALAFHGGTQRWIESTADVSARGVA